MPNSFSRRTVLGAAAAATMVGRASAAVTKPSSPLTITIVDVAGNLQLTQKAFEDYAKTKPEMVSHFNFSSAPAPELPGKILAQQAANRVDIDLVLTGTDALAAEMHKIWQPLLPQYASSLPNLKSILLEPAYRMQGLAQDQAILISYYPSGPLLEYMPDKIKTPPATAEDLLAYTKAHSGGFMYSQDPANSGPGRTFLMGLPYILGDKNPKDPMNGWDKTWSYLKELGQGIEYYPTGTTVVMKELGEGTRDIIATTTGWDINPRALGIVPKEAKVSTIKGFHWVVDAHYAAIPKGLDKERTAVLLDVISFVLMPKQQAYTYDDGYFYPGPAVKNVPLSMAPQHDQDVIKEYGRPEYAKLIADVPKELPLDAQTMVAAFRRWDEQIGAQKTK